MNIGIATDLGMGTTVVRGMLRGCHLLVLEANHDEGMVHDANRRLFLKRRVPGNQGHLSNRMAGTLAAEVAGDTLGTVVLAHLSRDCNREQLAIETVHDCLCRCGLDRVAVLAARADGPTPVCVCG